MVYIYLYLYLFNIYEIKQEYARLYKGVHPKRAYQGIAGSTVEFQTTRIIYKSIMAGIVWVIFLNTPEVSNSITTEKESEAELRS